MSVLELGKEDHFAKVDIIALADFTELFDEALTARSHSFTIEIRTRGNNVVPVVSWLQVWSQGYPIGSTLSGRILSGEVIVSYVRLEASPHTCQACTWFVKWMHEIRSSLRIGLMVSC